MVPIPLLDELAVVAILAVGVTIVLSRLRLPTVAGLLASGALLGPYGLRLTHSVHSIEVLAEIGVVLLLFSIGLEFSLARLRDVFRQVALGGALQIGLTVAVTAAVAAFLGERTGSGIFYGFVFALSSSAIVLRGLSERRELAAPHGKFILGTMIFQDLCVVPMVLIVPLLGGGGSPGLAAAELAKALGLAALVVTGTITVSRFLVPTLLGWVDASRSRDVFILAILGICIGTAWLTGHLGLSLALGAFLGGMVVADTEHGHRALSELLPLRSTFVSLFFVSLGMLFDVRVFLQQPLLVLLLLVGFVLGKGILATLAAMSMRFPARVALLAGVGLAQFGEFGYVLLRMGQDGGLIDERVAQPILAAGIASMFLTPLLVRAAPHFTAGEKLLAPLERILGVRSLDEESSSELHLDDHVLLVGFGLAGRLATRALKQCEIDCLVLELSSDRARAGRQLGLPVFYADATSEETLQYAQLEKARLVVLLMSDEAAARRVVDSIRRLAPNVPILMRTRHLDELPRLLGLGAKDVVAEEVEGAVEIIARMLRAMEVPRNVIDERIRGARRESDASSRKLTLPRSKLGDFESLRDMKIDSVLVEPGSRAVGESPITLRFRSETGALIVCARRGSQLIERPDPGVLFEAGDVVYLVGTGEALRLATSYFEAPKSNPTAD